MIAQQAPGRRRAKNRARWSGAALEGEEANDKE